MRMAYIVHLEVLPLMNIQICEKTHIVRDSHEPLRDESIPETHACSLHENLVKKSHEVTHLIGCRAKAVIHQVLNIYTIYVATRPKTAHHTSNRDDRTRSKTHFTTLTIHKKFAHSPA